MNTPRVEHAYQLSQTVRPPWWQLRRRNFWRKHRQPSDFLRVWRSSPSSPIYLHDRSRFEHGDG